MLSIYRKYKDKRMYISLNMLLTNQGVKSSRD